MRTRPASLLMFLSLLSTLLLSRAAIAGASGVVVIVGGDADRDTRHKLMDAVERGLRDRREETRELASPDVDGLVRCVSREDSKECAAAFMASTQASRAIVMRVVRGDQKPPTMTVTGWVIAPTGTVLVIDQGVCESCTAPKLEEVSVQLLGALLSEAEARTTQTTLVVRTMPPGAQVEIDDHIVGASNLEHGVYAGTHRIALQLNGYEPATRTVDVLAGESKVVEVTLAPVATGSGKGSGSAPPRHSTLAPWLVIGAGAVVASTGVVLLATNQSPPSSGPLHYEYRQTSHLGLAAAGVGVVAIGAGVWWLLHERTSERRRPDAPAPSVRIDPNGVMFVYGGGF